MLMSSPWGGISSLWHPATHDVEGCGRIRGRNHVGSRGRVGLGATEAVYAKGTVHTPFRNQRLVVETKTTEKGRRRLFLICQCPKGKGPTPPPSNHHRQNHYPAVDHHQHYQRKHNNQHHHPAANHHHHQKHNDRHPADLIILRKAHPANQNQHSAGRNIYPKNRCNTGSLRKQKRRNCKHSRKCLHVC